MEVEYPCLFFDGKPEQGNQAVQAAANELEATLTTRDEGGQEFAYQGNAILQGEVAEGRFDYLASKKYRSHEYLYFFLFLLLLMAFLELIILNLFDIKNETKRRSEQQHKQAVYQKQMDSPPIHINWAGVSLLPISMVFLWLRNRERATKPGRIQKIKAELKQQEDMEKLLSDPVNTRFTVRVNPYKQGAVIVFVLNEPEVLLPFLIRKILDYLPPDSSPLINEPLQQFLSTPVQIQLPDKRVDFNPLKELQLTSGSAEVNHELSEQEI